MPRRPTGADLLSQWTHSHPRRTGLPRLVYTFETCQCPSSPYPHLMEQIWHRACLAAAEASSA